MHPAILACTVGFCVLAPELVLLITRLSRAKSAVRADRSSLLQLWVTILCGIILAAPFGLFQAPEALRFELGAVGLTLTLFVLAGGLTLRWWAIRTLGKFFTVDVAVHKEHRLVTAGPYAWLRHPSYTGLLMQMFALALTFQHWIAVALIMVPTTAALLWRIALEERALAGKLGEVYQLYVLRSYCLVPFLALRHRMTRLPMPDIIPIDAHRPSESTRRGAVGVLPLSPSRQDLYLPPVPQRDSQVA
jgi:protein-S-isoprenylcysteine O-methyltransferase